MTSPESLATKIRKQRIGFFEQLLCQIPKPIAILDVGGTEFFWKMVEFSNADVEITLLNLDKQPTTKPNFASIVGDARSMQQFADAEFDVVFSNSVIEHLGTFEHQRQMADEVRRVGKRYFIQTPNKYFPIEPHFELPFFQWFPVTLRAWLASHLDLGWYRRFPSYELARKEVESIRLLTKPEMQKLFPEAVLREERVGGFTISFIAFKGWDDRK
jgi:hypothetical protein